MMRALVPPLAVALALVSGATLLFIAAAITPPPMSGAEALPDSSTTVADAWSVNPGIASLGQSTFAVLPPTPAVVDLARLIYAPGSGGRHTLPGPLLLVIESGVLTVQLDDPGQVQRGDSGTTKATGMFVLRSGDSLALPTATSAAFSNRGPEPVVALAAGIFPSGVVASKFGRVGLASWAESWSPGVSVQPLAGGWFVDPPSLSTTITLRRVGLKPGDAVPLLAAGPVDLAVETGALTLQARGGLVWWQPPQGLDVSLAPMTTATLLPGDAALLQNEASVTLRNAGSGPSLVLLLSVESEHVGSAAPHHATPVVATAHLDTGPSLQYGHVGTLPATSGSEPATPRSVATPPQGDVDPQRYLAQMTTVQHRQGLPLPAESGHLQSLLVAATPVDPSSVVADGRSSDLGVAWPAAK